MSKIFIVLTFTFMLQTNAVASTQNTKDIDTVFSKWSQSSAPGLAIKISKAQKTIYEKHFGLSNLAQQNIINKNTKFQIASVSKQFTAFAITLLATQNKLNLDDDIRKHLPEIPDYATPITILHLLHHTSGLRDLDDLNGMVGTGFSDYNDMDDVYKLITAQKALNFTPGERYSYSNSGYVLLAKIVEKVSSLSFREYMDKHVFTPIGMHNTVVFDKPFEVLDNRATAYYSSDNKTFTRDNGFSSVYGSTGIFTSVTDLDLWARNFVKPKAGNAEVFRLMKTTGVLNNGESTNYAFGQELKTMHGQAAIFHGGGTGAYRAYLIRFPEQELSISIVSNNSYTTFDLLNYIDQLAKILLPQQTERNPEPKDKAVSISISPAAVANYVGDYQVQPGLVFSVRLVNDELQLKLTGQPEAIDLEAHSINKFMLMDSDNGYYILFDNNGEQSELIRYYQGDFEYIGTRVDLVEFDRQSVDLNVNEGIYYSAELNTVYKLKGQGKQLKAFHARNLPISLTPFQPDVFISTTPFFQEVRFIKDKHRVVQGMLVSGSRSREVEFVKLSDLLD